MQRKEENIKMLKQRFKRIVNGVLAAVMCVGIFSAVSYVEPVTVSAANGSQEWYNPALRWKNATTNRENVLIANSLVSTETFHCSNRNCPTNSSTGFNDQVTGEGGNEGTAMSEAVGTVYRVPEYTATGKSYATTDSAIYYGPEYALYYDDSVYTAHAKLTDPEHYTYWSKFENKLPISSASDATKRAKSQNGESFTADDLVAGRVCIGYKEGSDYGIVRDNCKTENGETIYGRYDVLNAKTGEILDTYYPNYAYVNQIETYTVTTEDGEETRERTIKVAVDMPSNFDDSIINYIANNKVDGKINVVYKDADGTELNLNHWYLLDKNGNMVAEYASGYMPYGYLYGNYDSNGVLTSVGLINGAKITSPAEGGQYTGYHFTGSYCNSCGVWGTNDNDTINSQINNAMFALNPCHICYGDGNCTLDHNFNGDPDDDKHMKSTLKNEAGVTTEVERTYSNNEKQEDNYVHKMLDNSILTCIYCFGTNVTKSSDMYHIHPHDFGDDVYDTKISSDSTISVTKTCLSDNAKKKATETNYYNKIKRGSGSDICVTLSEDTTATATTCPIHGENTYTNGVTGKDVDEADVGCGYQETDNYVAMTTVDDYIGIVDGSTHYVTFGGKEVKGKSLTIDGDADDYTLDATFKWDDNAVHSRTLSGSQSAAYTITYSLPSGTGGDDDVVLTKHGTATITLIPTYVSESAEGDKNYYDNTSSSSSNDVILDSLLGNLVASGTVSVVGTTDTTSSNVTLSDTSNLIEIGTDDGIGEYDTYVPVTRTLLSPADDGTYITGTYIEVGTCSKRGDNLPHECAYTYPSGNIDFWRCIYCQMYLPIRRSTTVTYVHTHNYIKYSEIPATCSSKGLLVKMCVCGSQISEVLEENAGNHSGLSHKVDPAATCENDGYEYDECTGCGTIINGKLISKLGHQWSTTAISNGTGHNASYIVQTCDRCNKTQTISSTGTVTTGGNVNVSDASCSAHDYEYRYTERDCMTGTYEIWQCSICSEIEKRMTESATGHVWVEQSGGRESTCTINGYTNYICTKCGSTKVEMKPLDKTNHVRTTTVYEPAPTCETWGREYDECLACGEKTSAGMPVEPLGHDYKVLLDTDPTCFEEGLNVQQCTRCYEVVTTTTPALDHDYEESENSTVIDSQCTVDGLKELICKYCKTTKYEAISMTGHTPGDAATCTGDQTCTVCGAVLAKATGHTYVDEVTAPTCTTMGYTTHKCKDCDYSYIDTYTDAVDHTYTSKVTKPTCTTMGYTVYRCRVCGDEYIKFVPFCHFLGGTLMVQMTENKVHVP